MGLSACASQGVSPARYGPGAWLLSCCLDIHKYNGVGNIGRESNIVFLRIISSSTVLGLCTSNHRPSGLQDVLGKLTLWKGIYFPACFHNKHSQGVLKQHRFVFYGSESLGVRLGVNLPCFIQLCLPPILFLCPEGPDAILVLPV